MADTTTVTINRFYNDFKGALSAIADGLKTGSEHVYKILVTQQIVNSIQLLVIGFLLILTSYILYKVGMKNYFKKETRRIAINYGHEMCEVDEYVFQTVAIIQLVVAGILALAGVIVISVNSSEIITGFINPEYGALMEIKSFFK